MTGPRRQWNFEKHTGLGSGRRIVKKALVRFSKLGVGPMNERRKEEKNEWKNEEKNVKCMGNSNRNLKKEG